MSQPLNTLKQYRGVIIALVAVCFVWLNLFPTHYHLQHAPHDEPHGHAEHAHKHHVVDVHIAPSLIDLDTQLDGHAINSGQTEALKSFAPQLPLVLLSLLLLLLLPRAPLTLRLLRDTQTHPLPRYLRHTSPPLRAPPRR